MNELYVYGDFEGTIKALKMVAMIFASNNYTGLFISVLVITIVFGALTIYTDRIIGLQTNPLTIAKRVLFAMLLLLALVVPKGTMYVYDPVKNKTQSVSGIPQGIILFAGVTNKIYRGMKEIIETAGSPIISFDDLGYGTGFQMLNAVTTLYSSLSSISPQLLQNIERYIEDCVYIALSKGDITSEDLYKTTNLWGELKTTYNIFTTVIDGNVATCSSAYNTINTQINNNVNNVIASFCNSVGYDSTTVEQQRCRNQFSSMFNSFITSGSVNENNIIASYISAKSMVDLAANNGDIYAKTLAERNMVGSQLGAGSLGEIYLPYIQSLMSILLVCLFPIVVLLMLIAPSEAFKWYLGMYIWILMWGLIDVIFNTIIQDKAYTIFTEFRNNGGLGLENLLNLNSYSVKILGMYSNMRWMGASLSAAMAYGILKFGGYALASIAGGLGGSVQSAGASAGQALAMPGGSAKLQQEAFEKAVAASKDIRQLYTSPNIGSEATSRGYNIVSARTLANELSKNYGGFVNAGKATGQANAFNQEITNETAEKQQKLAGDRDNAVDILSKQKAASSVIQAIQDLAAIEKIRKEQGLSFEQASEQYYGKGAKEKFAAINTDYKLAKLFGDEFKNSDGSFNYDKFVDWKASGMILNKNMADELSNKTGYQVVEGQKVYQYGLSENGELAFFVGNKEGDGISIRTDGTGQHVKEVKDNKFTEYLNTNGELASQKGSWTQRLMSRLKGTLLKDFDKDFGNANINGEMTRLDNGLYRISNATISSDDGKNIMKTSLGGFLLAKKNSDGSLEIVAGTGIELFGKENEKLKIETTDSDGNIVNATLIKGNTEIHKSGDQYDVKGTLSKDERAGGYTILAGSEFRYTSAKGGDEKIEYKGNFLKDGKIFNGTLIKQGRSAWVFTEGKSGKDIKQYNVNKYLTELGNTYGDGTTYHATKTGDKNFALQTLKVNIVDGKLVFNNSNSASVNQSRDFAKTLNDIYSMKLSDQGIYSTDYSAKVSIGTGLNLWFFNAKGVAGMSVEFGDRSIEESSVNLWYKYDYTAKETAKEFAIRMATDEKGNVDLGKLQDLYAKFLIAARQTAINIAEGNLKETSSDRSGKSAPFAVFSELLEDAGLKKSEAKEFEELFAKNLKNSFENPQKNLADSGKDGSSFTKNNINDIDIDKMTSGLTGDGDQYPVGEANNRLYALKQLKNKK